MSNATKVVLAVLAVIILVWVGSTLIGWLFTLVKLAIVVALVVAAVLVVKKAVE